MGGQNIFGPSNKIDRFGPRTDFDIGLFWRFENFGFGNIAAWREQRAFHEIAKIRELQTAYEISAQVVQAHEQVQRSLQRVRVLDHSLFGEDREPDGPVFRNIKLNFARIKAGEGRPLETLDSIRGLNDTLESYFQAVTEYERARFRLLFALGLPAQQLLDVNNAPRPSGFPIQHSQPVPLPPRATLLPPR